MNLARGLVMAACVGFLATASCASDFSTLRGKQHLTVELVPPSNPGSRAAPLPLVINLPQTYRVKIRALNLDGSPDTSFSRYVRISARPGAIEPFAKTDATEGRNILLTNGESPEVDVKLVNAFGTTFIVAEDLGYVPVDPLRDPPPACANGLDDDGDGVIDFPADDGCAYPNDDSELGGTYAEGASPPIVYQLPRIADVRGLKCEPGLGCSSNGATPYPKEQIFLDTGYDDTTQTFRFDTVVSRISSSGYYATDLKDSRGGFTSLYAFNFNPPPRMRVCDRFKSMGGTASEFFGFTQLSYPTWTLEEWDPTNRRCLVPAPQRLLPGDIQDTGKLLALSGGLVRVETSTADASSKAMVTPKFGPGDTPSDKDPNGKRINFKPSADATNCDLNKDGKIDFAADSEEKDCNDTCTNDAECTEWSNYDARSTFRITVTDSNGQERAIQADASTSATFDPVALKGKPLRHFAGTLTYFSGGSQFTIEARCKDDIVIDLAQNPIRPDDVCTDDSQCPKQTNPDLPPIQCRPIKTGEKACRWLDPAKAADGSDILHPPDLACVTPRTIFENNPQ